MSHRTLNASSATDTYFELVKRFPLRRLRTATQRDMAAAIVRELGLRGEANLDAGQLDYLEALAKFIAEYEKSQAILPQATPLDVLKHLMETRNMRPIDLGKLIGPSAATMLLKGHRDFSKAHIRKLADFFAVSPAVFI